MNVQAIDNNIIITDVKDFSLRHIFGCGQCFRWDECEDGGFVGVTKGKVLKISQVDDTITLYNTTISDFYDIWYDYFDFKTDYSKIKRELSKDDVLKKASEFGCGIRILNQDFWECVVSFIISASNNIPRIKKIISALCENYGDEVSYMGKTYYTFPTPNKINSLSLDDLSVIKAGYRDKYIKAAAKAFVDGFSEDRFLELSYDESKKLLTQINGIGNKVSDCILLFSLSKRNSFPVDVWIKRTVEYFYFEEEQDIKAIKSFADSKFGDFGGYAQQYLFYYARENKIGV